jgi:hypothetical protein
MTSPFKAGQRWTYRAPEGYAGSRIVIGAILAFDERERVICCSVEGAPQREPDGSVTRITIPFLPMTEGAFARTVMAADGEGEVAERFAAHYQGWKGDPRGLSFFTVPFEGFLDRLIALQMAEIVGMDQA